MSTQLPRLLRVLPLPWYKAGALGFSYSLFNEVQRTWRCVYIILCTQRANNAKDQDTATLAHDDDDDDDGGPCRCIVALHILRERHRLQICSNGGSTTSH